MQIYEKKQIRVIVEQNLHTFQVEFNSFMNQLAEQEIVPEVTFPQGTVGIAYIVYAEKSQIPEDYSDKFSLRGMSFTCPDCPMWETFDKSDHRIKYYRCSKGNCQAYKNRRCCETYLKELWEEEHGAERED